MGLAGQTFTAVNRQDVVIDRINRAVMKLIARRAGSRAGILHVDDAGVRAVVGSDTRWSIPWSEVKRVIAFRSAGFVGDSLVLAIEGNDETRLATEDQPGWHELVVALPKRLEGATQYQHWAPSVVSGDEENPFIVFARR